jgi:hypothetical protein
MAACGRLRHCHCRRRDSRSRNHRALRRRGSGIANQRPAACRNRFGVLRRSCCLRETASTKPHEPCASPLTSTGSTRRSPAALSTTGRSRRRRLVLITASGLIRATCALTAAASSANTAYRDDDKTTRAPIQLFHGIADDWVAIGPCRDYIARLKSAGADASLTEYPDATHAYDVTQPSKWTEPASSTLARPFGFWRGYRSPGGRSVGEPSSEFLHSERRGTSCRQPNRRAGCRRKARWRCSSRGTKRRTCTPCRTGEPRQRLRLL